MYNLLKLNEYFLVEKELMNTKYPFSKNRLKLLIEELKKIINDFDNRSDKFDILREKLEYLVEKNLSKNKNQIITMKYCKDSDEKKKYKVFLKNDKLCYYRNGEYLPIDSISVFKEFFDGRTPEEDEKYLESIGYPLLPERSGKSNFSCFVIDKNMDLYINPYRPDTIQHTFTTRGEDVLCAGLLLLKDGVICYIDNTSGHYRANNEKLELLFIFLKNNTEDKNITKYFDKNFLECRENFSWPLKEIIRKNECGLKFRDVFREKTFEEIEKEKKLRKSIFERYNLQ